ncbi:MAG: acyl-CoA synthetase FdrA [Bacteroidetes bacterium]|nr:acyl-CoA synthetase FdrA [Bacteroidota bacterium]
MIFKGLIKKGSYYDSVSLMILSKELNKLDGIVDSSIVMGTAENKALLSAVGLNLEVFHDAGETDILIGIKASSLPAAENALQKIDQLFNDLQHHQDQSTDKNVHSFGAALKQLPEANLSLISIAGKYAAGEAMKALKQGLHVMIFSDNVSIAEEYELKQYAHDHELLLMGPDCGSAIINGIPLGFANVVQKGNIGIVAASGTGLQEVSSVISNHGAGISQAIGTGGRDIRKEIGGIMFLDALKVLGDDEETKVIVMISKPPHPDVLQKIADHVKKIKKPVIGILIGGNPEILRQAGVIPAITLEQAGLYAAAVSKGKETGSIDNDLAQRKTGIVALASTSGKGLQGKFLRGLFSGGTLCDETQLVLKDTIGYTYSNSPLNVDFRLTDLWKSRENSIIDLGEDEFTQGRPHPMIDYSLRNKRILQEVSDTDVAVILLDVVLGYGSHPDPASELVPVIHESKKISPAILFIGSVTGTDQDPQNKKNIVRELEKAGMIIMPSNVAASELAGQIIHQLSSKQPSRSI